MNREYKSDVYLLDLDKDKKNRTTQAQEIESGHCEPFIGHSEALVPLFLSLVYSIADGRDNMLYFAGFSHFYRF